MKISYKKEWFDF